MSFIFSTSWREKEYSFISFLLEVQFPIYDRYKRLVWNDALRNSLLIRFYKKIPSWLLLNKIVFLDSDWNKKG